MPTWVSQTTDERTSREALYGPRTRSGQVNLTPLRGDEFGRLIGTHAADEWVVWEHVTWPFGGGERGK